MDGPEPPNSQLWKEYHRELKIWEKDERGSLNAVVHFLRSLEARWYLRTNSVRSSVRAEPLLSRKWARRFDPTSPFGCPFSEPAGSPYEVRELSFRPRPKWE